MSKTTTPRPLLFRKSSYSANAAECVEVADTDSGAAVRDSKNPEHGHLSFAATEWQAFLGDVKAARL
ncbi:hypothetical protein GCM10007147_36010 [Nocardiopsis kunsanensis]|uniref:DUF397 domain-containing protein n=1 Tax=Nocardiopsis kunsanensis TaxID=141693 RepID=A0A918XI71_9ACTN|nr:DUF397 domain-containing protein [Nocardiopsis kunsanensis]GHD32413.1 hypothetical protein GCM10007147_36010 [Nocardiopsis kunsanensis]